MGVLGTAVAVGLHCVIHVWCAGRIGAGAASSSSLDGCGGEWLVWAGRGGKQGAGTRGHLRTRSLAHARARAVGSNRLYDRSFGLASTAGRTETGITDLSMKAEASMRAQPRPPSGLQGAAGGAQQGQKGVQGQGKQGGCCAIS